MDSWDIVIVGAGAAGLMAAIRAAQTAPGARVLALDGARTLGAKILVSGGGRCNVTHERVQASDYAGSTAPAIARVLRQFSVPETIAFFTELGVPLKREDTGKLFPVSNRARDVLEALIGAATGAGVVVRNACRVQGIAREGSGFALSGPWGRVFARRVILATGGQSLPKSGSDGGGYQLARALGHSLTPHLFPALAPLLLPDGHFLRSLSGLSFECRLRVQTAQGKALRTVEGAALCTHFGLSGPAVLDVSRHWRSASLENPGAQLAIHFLPGISADEIDLSLRGLGRRTPLGWLSERLPDRLARALVEAAGIPLQQPGSQLSREARRTLVQTITALVLPITGDRGYTYAEATAGGVPLAELHPDTLESRLCPGLYLCGEICDVDGRIGGFNFQWAWASGHVAGTAAASMVSSS